jgi:ATP-dependent helicase/nuclease subunit A
MSESALNTSSLPDDFVSRETDPNVLQRRAAKPDSSAWVGASAGAGKTKVLTDRMIRLMLPHADGQPSSHPGNILALTFTKAAANEMALRLNRRLSEWAVIDDDALTKDMTALLGRTPTAPETKAARQLFARVVDAPGGMKIMTIHSFCQSILGRFPLEAGLPPHFTPLEEGQDTALLQQAQDTVLARAVAEKTSPLALALDHLAGIQSEDQFAALLNSVIRERAQVGDLLARHFGPEGIYAALCTRFGIHPGQTPDDIIKGACAAGSPHEQDLRNACRALGGSSKDSDINKGQDIQTWLDAADSLRFDVYARYRSAFLTNDGDIRKKHANKEVVDAFPDIVAILQTEAERLLTLEDQVKAARTASATRDLLILGSTILDAYSDLKEHRAALDFDDLILKTLALLQGRTMKMNQKDVAPWVRFKLDQGIDHILIDEAQDTNPEQWEIIKALTEDFFSGDGARDIERTVFVVGDEKQSIFSFQRAAPAKMGEMQDWFTARIQAADKNLEDIPINISFRSAPAILKAVDATFASDDMRKGLGRTVAPHIAFRRKQPGLVEQWPVMIDSKNGDTDDGWTLPISISEASSGAAQLCAHIGDTIKEWLDKKEQLPARGRPIEPGDIMILVRTRTAFVGQLVRALKTRGVPISGVDRMVLKDQLAVQDLISASAFGLLPEDDLALAELLKSPLVGWTDDQLYAIAQPRPKGQSLWAALKDSIDGPLAEWLSTLIRRAAQDHPFEFFSRLLKEPCPADAISGLRGIRGRLGIDALDPIDEFLNRTLAYEKGNIPTLQGFVHWHEAEAVDIKRQMEEGSGTVRIMTVHASKGLQAPIVILPDTLRGGSSRKPERILWPDRSGFDLPLFLPSKDMMPQQAQDAYDTVEARLEEEYQRLLYVAMTRAEDRLYVGGYRGKTAALPTSWYNSIRTGLESLPETESIPLDDDHVMVRLTNPATDGPDRAGKDKSHAITKAAPASWLFAPAPQEPSPPRPLVPSRPSGTQPPAASPLATKDTHRFRRGTLTHRLLQFLPELPLNRRAQAAQDFIRRSGNDLPEEIQDMIVTETLGVLNDPVFAPLFGPGSLAEISVAGLIDDTTLISGQIDRLLITDTEIFIIDYKTNRPPPTHVDDVPVVYVRQMQAYAKALMKIYPGRVVRSALLWTDGPRLMELSVLV